MAKQNPKQKIEKNNIETPAIEKIYNPWMVFGGILALVFISYSMIWQNGFVWDDDPYIVLNEAVKTFDLGKL
jgi:protein O-mannosyl-transferase